MEFLDRATLRLACRDLAEDLMNIIAERVYSLFHCHRREGNCSGRQKETVLHWVIS